MIEGGTVMLRMKVSLAVAVWGAVVALSGEGMTVRQAVSGPAPTSHPDKKRLNSELVNLPANTWVKIKPNRNPEGRSFTGICWGNGLIYYFGGGHHSYTCNDVELYDVAANTWTKATEPEDWRDAQAGKWTHLTPQQAGQVFKIVVGAATNEAGILSPKGRPITGHSYAQQCWFPEEKAFYILIPRHAPGLWAFDPAKREWTLVSKQIPRPRDLSCAALTYDPGLKTVVAIVSDRPGEPGAHVFDREKKCWVRRCALPTNTSSEVHTAYDSNRRVHVVHTQRQWFTMDLAAGTTKPIKPPDEVMKTAGKFPFKDSWLNEASLAYDPEAKVTLFLTKSVADRARGDDTRVPVDLWAYDAETDTWSQVKMSGQAPTGFYRWGLLVYDADHKCCLLLNVLGVQGSARWGGPVDGLFAFRLKK